MKNENLMAIRKRYKQQFLLMFRREYLIMINKLDTSVHIGSRLNEINNSFRTVTIVGELHRGLTIRSWSTTQGYPT